MTTQKRARACIFLCASLATFLVPATEPRRRVLLAVDGGDATPIAEIDARGGLHETHVWDNDSVMADDPRAPDRERGRTFYFYRLGAPKGRVQVVRRYAGGVGVAAIVRPVGSRRVDRSLTGLATTAPLTARAARQPSVLTPADARQLDQALTRVLMEKGASRANIKAALLARAAEEDGGTARHAVAGPRTTYLVATLRRTLASQVRDPMNIPGVQGTVILERTGTRYRNVHVDAAWYESVDTLESREYIDHLDIDGNGVPELIFRVNRYEGRDYEVWRRQRDGAWSIALIGGFIGS